MISVFTRNNLKYINIILDESERSARPRDGVASIWRACVVQVSVDLYTHDRHLHRIGGGDGEGHVRAG